MGYKRTESGVDKVKSMAQAKRTTVLVVLVVGSVGRYLTPWQHTQTSWKLEKLYKVSLNFHSCLCLCRFLPSRLVCILFSGGVHQAFL